MMRAAGLRRNAAGRARMDGCAGGVHHSRGRRAASVQPTLWHEVHP
jgi:hypothetical protein